MTLTGMPRPLTEEEAHFLNEEFASALDWLGQVVHWTAILQAMTLVQKHPTDQVRVYQMWPKYDRFSYEWYTFYGRVYITLQADDRDYFADFNPSDWRRHRAVDQKWSYYDQEFLAHFAMAIDELIRDFLPGIKRKNSLQVCAMPAHTYQGSQEVIRQPRLYLCNLIGGQWICEACLKVYNLGELTLPPLPEKKRSHFEREWAKLMKPQRRLEILERDKFTCQRCRRSPLREYGVELMVRHVTPVTEGGKTTPDNLITLCTDCVKGNEQVKIMPKAKLQIVK